MSTIEHAAHRLPEHGDFEAPGHAHPGPRQYIIIGVILAIITAVEVGIYTEEAVRPLLVPILLALSAVKFALVVGYFMHLRFDSRIFLATFTFGLLVAGSIITALLALHGQLPPPPPIVSEGAPHP